MTQQRNDVYYQDTDPSQVSFYPYGAPPTDDRPVHYPQVQGAYIEQSTPPNPNMSDPMRTDQLNAEHIRDYMWWSAINICFGGLLLGVIAVLLSQKTKKHKQKKDVKSARKWSRITLIYNIFVDLVTVALIIIIVVFAIRNQNSYTYGYGK